MLQEKKGLEIRNNSLQHELAAQHDHLEELRGHEVKLCHVCDKDAFFWAHLWDDEQIIVLSKIDHLTCRVSAGQTSV